MQHNLSFSGGKNKLNYLLSLNHRSNNGILKTSKNSTNTALLNLSTKLLNDDLEINLRNKTAWVKNQFAPNVLQAALDFDPTQPVRDMESPYGGYFQWDDILATNNPVATLEQTDEEGKATRTINSIELKYHLPFLDGLTFTGLGSYDLTDGEKMKVNVPLLKENFLDGGHLFTEEERHVSKLLETYFTYNKELKGAKSNINF